MKVQPLLKKDCKAAAQVVADAFYDYPSLIAYFPDPKRRTQKMPWYMEHVLKSALAYGEAWTTVDRSGVLFLLPPNHTVLSDWDYVKCGFLAAPLVVGIRQYAVVNENEVYLAKTQEALLKGRPHYYLWGLAVDPKRQHSGMGKALLYALFAQADREGLPIYLETHRFENVVYYESHGFQLIHTDRVPKCELKFWCMLREPGTIEA
jgi:GNAT superfamily N-acetyltransferase